MHVVLRKKISKVKLNRKKMQSKRRKKYCTTNSAIIQLHAIVYAVIYYDFRITLWRLSVGNSSIHELKYIFSYMNQ